MGQEAFLEDDLWWNEGWLKKIVFGKLFPPRNLLIILFQHSHSVIFYSVWLVVSKNKNLAFKHDQLDLPLLKCRGEGKAVNLIEEHWKKLWLVIWNNNRHIPAAWAILLNRSTCLGQPEPGVTSTLALALWTVRNLTIHRSCSDELGLLDDWHWLQVGEWGGDKDFAGFCDVGWLAIFHAGLKYSLGSTVWRRKNQEKTQIFKIFFWSGLKMKRNANMIPYL